MICHPKSPSQLAIERRIIRKASAYATAEGLRLASMAEHGHARQRLATLARRVERCATSSHFKIVNVEGEASYVRFVNKRACRFALCFSCSAHRARQAISNVGAQFDRLLAQNPAMRFAFLTLTSRNVPVAETKSMFDRHEAALARFWRLKPVAAAFLGHITSFEVTISPKNLASTAHVHSHSIVALHPRYFDRDRSLYLKQARIVELWRSALRADYKPICDIRPIRHERAALVEALKYAVAPRGYVSRQGDRYIVDPEVAASLVSALYRRRLLRMGGIFTSAKGSRSRSQP